MAELGHPFTSIGCPAYPQGHPDIPDAALAEALRDKAPFVEHMYDPDGLRPDGDRALGRRPAAPKASTPESIVGLPGVADPQKLLSIAARIGVKDAQAVPRQEPALRDRAGRARAGSTSRRGCVEDLAPLIADAAARVTGLHLYTFNAVEATEAWRRSEIETLA